MAGSSSRTNERSNMMIKDFAESTKVVLERVQQLDPENASKILGHLLSQEYVEQEVMNMADVSDSMFTALIEEIKEDLNLSPKTNQRDKQPIVSKLSTSSTPFIPSSSRFPPRVPQVNNVQIDSYAPGYQPVINNYEHAPVPYVPHYHPQFLPLEAPMAHGLHNVPERAWNAGPSRVPVLPDTHFYQQRNDGHCPGQEAGEIPVQVWIQRLEIELIEILKSKGPLPVPVASLPALYSENFGQKLLNFMQAKVGCTLHELLAQMSRRIRMIERPCGALFVMLSEDIPKYVKIMEEKKLQEQANSCQIFLTFPQKSTFTAQEIYDYFTTIGPVRGVRIPSQVMRMYAFVTFSYAATVAVVLSTGNPQHICGMQVLVKPYRGREILWDRISDEDVQFSVWSLSEEDSVRLSKARLGKFVPKKQLTIEEHGQSLDPRMTVANPRMTTADPRMTIANIPAINAGAGPNAPRGVSIGSADKGKSIVITNANEEERNDKGKSIMPVADQEARNNDKGKSIMAVANEEARINDKGKSILAVANEEARYNDKGKNIVAVADDDEARYIARVVSIMDDADEEDRYDDLNLPDSPFAFEASQYDFAFAMNCSDREINDSET